MSLWNFLKKYLLYRWAYNTFFSSHNNGAMPNQPGDFTSPLNNPQNPAAFNNHAYDLTPYELDPEAYEEPDDYDGPDDFDDYGGNDFEDYNDYNDYNNYNNYNDFDDYGGSDFSGDFDDYDDF